MGRGAATGGDGAEANLPWVAWLTWRAATAQALYGPEGFYRRPEGPAGHFRTSVHASPLFAGAVLELARAAGLSAIVDVGSGRGELLRTLHRMDPQMRLHGVDLAERPPDLPADITWSAEVGTHTDVLLFANEWLDAIPLDVVEKTRDGLRLVEVDPSTGEQRLGDAPDEADEAWLRQWWPLDDAEPGDRAEIGRPRDDAWAAAVGGLGESLAVAVDYAHLRQTRPAYDTLVGYRTGRVVPAVPDGSCDISAHVAIDACAAAGERAGASTTVLTTQREALRALGVRGGRPPIELAKTDPVAYMQGLSGAGQAAELTDAAGLGRFAWLVQAVGRTVPDPLAAPH